MTESLILYRHTYRADAGSVVQLIDVIFRYCMEFDGSGGARLQGKVL